LSNQHTSTTIFCVFAFISSREKSYSFERDVATSMGSTASYRFVADTAARLQIRRYRFEMAALKQVAIKSATSAAAGWFWFLKTEADSGLTKAVIFSLQLRRRDNFSLQFCRAAMLGIRAAFERGQ
jgi:hypothetical protein